MRAASYDRAQRMYAKTLQTRGGYGYLHEGWLERIQHDIQRSSILRNL